MIWGIDYETIDVCIGLLAIIIGAIVPTVTYLKRKEKKKLTFKGLANLSHENIKGDLKDVLEIRYPDRLASDLFLLVANIRNTGDLSIRNYDIITPIKISFQEKFFDCLVTAVNQEGMDVPLTINHDDNSVECNFELLNVRDDFTLTFVSLEKLSIPKIICRIDGLSKIHTSNFDIIYSYLNPVKRGLKKIINVLRDTDFTKPIFTFTLPGIIMLIASFIMGFNLLQTYAMGRSLNFGHTVLTVLLLIGGAFMVLLGILIHLAILNYKSYKKFNKPIVPIVVLGSLLLIGSLYQGTIFLQTYAMGGSLNFGTTMAMIMLFVIGVLMVLISLMMYLVFSNNKS